MTWRVLAALGVATCAGPETAPPSLPSPPPPPDAAVLVSVAEVDAETELDEPPASSADAFAEPEVWLRGSTHVHAKPSGDSATPLPDVIRWYEVRDYDFIVVTDHNRVTEIDSAFATPGEIVLRPATQGLIVFAGIELTYNPTGCLPPGDATGKCRIHVNLLGVTGRPLGKQEWANRKTDDRIEKYQAAIERQKMIGGLAQLNHPSWFWGMTPEVLAEVTRRGIPLVEIANVQFDKWNVGDKEHPLLDAMWDAALIEGVTLWGVASDDAHHYDGKGRYPAGGGWVVVKSRREPRAILDALARGRFYSSTGVTLDRAEVERGELVVEIAASSRGKHEIVFVENGKEVERVTASTARRAVPAMGYVRAVVIRADGKQAWVQPARR